MIILNEYKAHHFIPAGNEFNYTIKAPVALPYSMGDDYRVEFANNIDHFVFPEDHYPARVDDILVESTVTKMVLTNRIYHDQYEVERRTTFEYDISTRTITFTKKIKGGYKIHWFDFSKVPVYQEHWRKLPLSPFDRYVNKTQYQGFYRTNPTDENQPNIITESGHFQGGFRCHFEINTLPVFGMVCYSNDLKCFMYRGSSETKKPKDTFQFRVYNPLGQESDPYCYRITIT